MRSMMLAATAALISFAGTVAAEPVRLADAELTTVTAGLGGPIVVHPAIAALAGNRLSSDPRLSPAGLASRFRAIVVPTP